VKTDAYIKERCCRAVRRAGMNMDAWQGTQLWDQGEPHLKAELSDVCEFDSGELGVLYAHVGPVDWTLVTTRRVWSMVDGRLSFMAASEVANWRAVNFKGLGEQASEQMDLTSQSGTSLRCPYNTGRESMGPLNAIIMLVRLSRRRNASS
jgi:hypothetical protein